MLDKKEIYAFLAALLVLSLTVSFSKNFESIGIVTASIFLILLINVAAKKISGFYLDSETEISLWNIKRFGFKKSAYFKKPFPAGILLPIIFSVASLGNILWMASLVFEPKPKTYRAAKRHGLYSYSEMTEYHIGIIAATGIFANLVFAFIGYFLGFSEFTRLSIYYAFFNLLPLSDLDGNKIFFGSLILWSFLASLILIGLGYAFFLI